MTIAMSAKDMRQATFAESDGVRVLNACCDFLQHAELTGRPYQWTPACVILPSLALNSSQVSWWKSRVSSWHLEAVEPVEVDQVGAWALTASTAAQAGAASGHASCGNLSFLSLGSPSWAGSSWGSACPS